MIKHESLMEEAVAAMKKAYSPYTTNRVGAALATSTGSIWLGGNIGNSCSTLNCCAEQSCIVQAVMNGEYSFVAIAVAQLAEGECFPCGRCLQLLSEFSSDLTVITQGPSGLNAWKLDYLLPRPFKRAPEE